MSDYGRKLEADSRWEVESTGGGFSALIANTEHYYWLISNQDDIAPEQMNERVTLGLFSQGGGNQIGFWTCDNVWLALAIANGFTPIS